MRIERDSEYILSSEKVSLILPFTRLPVQFDTWVWKVPVGHVMEIKIGLLVSQLACLFPFPAVLLALIGLEFWRRFWIRRHAGNVPALPGLFLGMLVYFGTKIFW